MFLNDDEKRMLDGAFGEGVQRAMELQVAVAKAFDAEKMVPVSRTHVALSGQEGDTYWCETLVNGGAKCKVPCTTNPAWDVKVLTRHYGVTQEELDLVLRTYDVYTRIGAIMSLSCTPELQQNVPAFGEIVAFSESSATPYINSVLGARSNRESSVSALAAAVTGVAPLYGLMFDENRRGTMLVDIDFFPSDIYDWGIMGWYIGRFVGNEVPVLRFKNLPRRPRPEMLVYLGAELNTSGAVPMYHIIGVTPEAPTFEAAFGGNKPVKEIHVTKNNLKEQEEILSEKGSKINMVMLGCPHYTLSQLQEIEALLKGRRAAVPFWVLSSQDTITLAKRCGVFQSLEACGVGVVAETCIDEPCFKVFEGGLGMTDSPKCAYYRKMRNQPFIIRRLSECVEAAVKGGI